MVGDQAADDAVEVQAVERWPGYTRAGQSPPGEVRAHPRHPASRARGEGVAAQVAHGGLRKYGGVVDPGLPLFAFNRVQPVAVAVKGLVYAAHEQRFRVDQVERLSFRALVQAELDQGACHHVDRVDGQGDPGRVTTPGRKTVTGTPRTAAARSSRSAVTLVSA